MMGRRGLALEAALSEAGSEGRLLRKVGCNKKTVGEAFEIVFQSNRKRWHSCEVRPSARL